MLRRWLTVLLAVLTALVAASPASASTHLGPQTRVGAFELAAHTLVGPAALRTPENRRAKSLAKPVRASDPRLRWKGRPYLEVAGGVYDMRARWWSPRLGAFLSADNFGYYDANSTLWGWGDQNPAKWNDPSGNCGPQCVGIAGGAAAGLAIGLYQTNWNGSAADIASDLAFATAAGAVVGGTLGEGYGAVAAAYELGGGTLAGAARVLAGLSLPALTSSPAAQSSGGDGGSCPVVSVFHASIDNGEQILQSGLDPSRAPVFASRDLAAAQDALVNHPDAVPGAGTIIESQIPQDEFDSTMASFERPYSGFYPYNLQSTEITLRTPEQIQTFNQYIVKPP